MNDIRIERGLSDIDISDESPPNSSTILTNPLKQTHSKAILVVCIMILIVVSIALGLFIIDNILVLKYATTDLQIVITDASKLFRNLDGVFHNIEDSFQNLTKILTSDFKDMIVILKSIDSKLGRSPLRKVLE